MSGEKPLIKVSGDFVGVNKEAAALTQLESAMVLWFNWPSPVSIHTLAVAAHACYCGIARHAGLESSIVEDWLKTQPNWVRRLVKDPQNFFKHGHTDKKGARTAFMKLHAEMLMIECMSYHERLYDELTPLMRTFGIRFVGENPEIISTDNAGTIFQYIDAHPLHGLKIDQLFNLKRPAFLQTIFPIFAEDT